jgi:MFS family permease
MIRKSGYRFSETLNQKLRSAMAIQPDPIALEVENRGSLAMHRRWWVLGAVMLGFFFLNAATFTSLGVALYSMVAELHWSATAAGFSFSLLGIACGLSSPVPAALLKRIGARWTITLGGLTLTVGFVLAATANGLPGFYLAMVLLGVGYSLAGNVPAVYLLASWFPQSTPRIIGIYLMAGASGAVVGPPMVQIIAASGGWRMHWLLMAMVAAAIGLISFVCIRDLDRATGRNDEPMRSGQSAVGGWTSREAMMTPQFVFVAASVTLTLACVTAIHGVAVSHLMRLGATQAAAALGLSVMALAATVAKGLAGPLCERIPARLLLSGGAVFQALGVIIFASAGSASSISAFALAFGIGWGLAFLAANVLLLEYFGPATGSQLLAMTYMFSTIAAAAPVAAGATADHFGTYAPVFYLLAVLLMILAFPMALMEKPRLREARA